MQMQGRWDVYAPGQRCGGGPRIAPARSSKSTTAPPRCAFDAPVAELRRDGTLPTRAGAIVGAARARSVRGRRRSRHRAGQPRPARGRRTVLADALLDQRVASGIGNVFKSEVCWAGPRASRGHRCTQSIPSSAARCSTPRHRFLVDSTATGRRTTYGSGLRGLRQGPPPVPALPDPDASAPKLGATPRVTYWCPTCQPTPPLGGRLSTSVFDT